MKKTYIAPQAVSVKLNIESLLGGGSSPQGINFDGNGRGSITPNSGNAVGAAMGRGGFDWDDEE